MIPLEDNAADIIGKAQRGLGISDSELAEKTRVSAQIIRKLRDGDFDESTLLSVAPVLGLDGTALGEIAQGDWHPNEIESLDGLAQFTTDYNGMAVNAYIVWNAETRVAAAFDTGADSGEMLRFAKRHKLDVQLILLTHAHPDHVADLPALREETGADVFTPAREPVPGAEPIEEGKKFRAWKSANRHASDLGSFPWRNNLRCDRAHASDRNRRRFAFCRVNGRRQCVVSRCLTK